MNFKKKEQELFKGLGEAKDENEFFKKKVQAPLQIIEPDHRKLSIRKQCSILGIS